MSPALNGTPVLETDRLKLRAPVASDVQPWVDFLVTDRGFWTGGGPEGGVGKAWRVVALMFGHWVIHGYGLFVLERHDTGQPIGAIGPYFPGDWPEQEMGWCLWSPEDEGKGYGVEAARRILGFCFEDLGWDTAVSYIAADNAPSIALARRLGATPDPDAARPARADLVFRHPKTGAS